MSAGYATADRAAMLAAQGARLEGRTLRYYTSPRPADSDAPVPDDATMLAPVVIQRAVVTGATLTLTLAKGVIWVTGTATWARAETEGGAVDLSVGLTGSGANLELPLVQFVVGSILPEATVTLTMPETLAP